MRNFSGIAGLSFQIAPDDENQLDHHGDIALLDIWQRMGDGHPVIAAEDGGLLPLTADYREFYLLFAEAQDYLFILVKDAAPGIDKWRFTKQP
jgi:hypothetical protein